jgi:hypothetical protein
MAFKTAGIMSIAEGSVFIYTMCACRAIRHLHDQHLAWPGQERREFLLNEMAQRSFPKYIGIADGSYIRLVFKPKVNGYAYWC